MLDHDLEMPCTQPFIYEICPDCGSEMDCNFGDNQFECICGKVISFPEQDWEVANDY
jgi:hypothetical protein